MHAMCRNYKRYLASYAISQKSEHYLTRLVVDAAAAAGDPEGVVRVLVQVVADADAVRAVPLVAGGNGDAVAAQVGRYRPAVVPGTA